MQGALEFLGIPYTGSGVTGSAIAHGQAAHQAPGRGGRRADAGVRGAAHAKRISRWRSSASAADDRQARLAGVERRHDARREGRGTAGRLARGHRSTSRWPSPSPGSRAREYTVSILQGAALPSIRIETPRAFYDYEAKYLRDDTRQDLSLGPGRRGRAAAGAALARRLRGLRRRGLGPRRFHDGRSRASRCCSRSTPCRA